MPNVKSTKLLQKRSDQAVVSFHKYYASIWTEERWHGTLYPALCQPTRYCALLNLYVQRDQALKAVVGESGSSEDLRDFKLPQIQSTKEVVHDGLKVILPEVKQGYSSTTFPPPTRIEMQHEGTHLSHWNMDGASVLAACMLQVRPGEQVLDLCAAPGGKSLVLAQMLWPDSHAGALFNGTADDRQVNSFLQSNEVDQGRNRRLSANLQSYLPEHLFSNKAIQVTCIDGTSKSAAEELTLGEGGYDKVLVDAPCSSERHIVHAHLKASSSGQIAEEMANWKPSHSKTLAKTQVSLLMTALKAVRTGGIVVYATCSISDDENDQVIERVIELVKKERKRHPDRHAWKIKLDIRFEQDQPAKELLDSLTERTKHGRIALPDHAYGGRWGPLYFCSLQKVACHNKVIGDG